MVMNFNLKYYRVFVAVYENRSMSIAAEKLFFSQPAVSRIISELEQAYNTRFFHRHSGQLQYTEGGKKFYFYAKQLLNMEEQLDSAMDEQRLLHKVYIGATPTIATYYLPDILKRYQSQCGELDVYLRTLPSAGIDEMLKSSRLDMAIVENMRSTYEMEVVPIANDDLIFVVNDNYVMQEPVPILLRDLGDQARQSMEQQLYEAGIPHILRGEFTDVDGVKQYAAHGFGVGIIPKGTLTPQDPLRILDLPQLSISMPLAIASYRKKFVFPELKNLMDWIEDGLRQSLGK